MHVADARKHGETEQRRLIAAWEEAGQPVHRARAGRAGTDRRPSPSWPRPCPRRGLRQGPPRCSVSASSRQVIAMAVTINAWNRFNVATRMPGAPSLVTKLHPPGTDPQALRERLRVALRCPGVVVAGEHRSPRRSVTSGLARWPGNRGGRAGTGRAAVGPGRRATGPPASRPLGDFAVPHGAPARLARALARLGGGPVAAVIRRAADLLEIPARPIHLVHGDFPSGTTRPGRTAVGAHRSRRSRCRGCALGPGPPGGYWAAGMVPDAGPGCVPSTQLTGPAGGLALRARRSWPILDFARSPARP